MSEREAARMLERLRATEEDEEFERAFRSMVRPVALPVCVPLFACVSVCLCSCPMLPLSVQFTAIALHSTLLPDM